jgi:colanic acid biosynthesis glycosyl transferase WcaI
MENVESRKQKILVVCQHYWPESFRLNDVCDYFIEQGYEVDVLCGIPNYPKGKFFDGYGYFKNRKQKHNKINIERVFEVPRGDGSNLKIIINNLSFPIASLFHIPRLLTRKYDKILIYESSPVMMAIAGIIVGKIKKIETIMWVIDIWPENLFSYLKIKNKVAKKVATAVSHWHYKNVDKLVATSESMKKKLMNASNISPSNIVTLPQACEKIFEMDMPDKFLEKKFKKGFNILFTGTITPILSFETVLKAASSLKDKGFKDINWIIVGDGMSRKWLEEEVRNLNLGNNFFFEGLKPKEEIPKYTTSVADVLFSSLIKDKLLEVTVPAKVFSYLAAGKPIVLSIDGEAQDLINNKIGCGFASPAEDWKELAQNIEKMYKLSPTQREKLGRRAKTYHFENLERNVVMKKLEIFMQDST